MWKQILAAVLILVSAPVWAADQPTQQTPCNAAYQAADRARQNADKLAAEQYAMVQQAQRPLTGSTSSGSGSQQGGGIAGCLEKYKDVNIAGGLGVPNASQIFDKMMKSASAAVCNGIDSAYNNVARQTSAEAVLPGGIAGGKVSLPSAYQIPSVANDPLKVTTTNPSVVNSAEQKMREEIRGLYK